MTAGRASARRAHLHLNVLGWTGLLVLATVLFFAPAMFRVRIPEGVMRRGELRGRGLASRNIMIARTHHRGVTRAVVLNTAVLTLVLGTALPQQLPAAATATAWTAVVAVLVHVLLLASWPVGRRSSAIQV